MSRRIPLLVYFADDDEARRATRGCSRFLRNSYERLEGVRRDGNLVFVVSDERWLAQFHKELRMPNVRVVALSDERFADPRLDGVVYAYVPRDISTSLLERTLENALEHMHLISSRRDTSTRLSNVDREICELNQIGAALSAEHDPQKLLSLILAKCREITHADAGSIYLVEEESALEPSNGQPRPRIKLLRIQLAQNDSLGISLQETVLPIGTTSVAGYCALRGSVEMIEDAYNLGDVPYTFNSTFDEHSGYRTRSILAVPMRNPKREVVGVVQLINSKRDWNSRLRDESDFDTEVTSFTMRQCEIVLSLASQAAVAFENSQLYENIRRLFEGFVEAAVTAIEQRDPSTRGHSSRVTNLTVALAEAISQDDEIFKDVRFTREEMRELRYACLLHDFGKVGVREQVLVKARKLYPAQLEAIRQRFDLVRRTLEADHAAACLRYVLEHGRERYEAEQSRFEEEWRQQKKELDRYWEFILCANEPTVLPSGSFEVLQEIAARSYRDGNGELRPLLTSEEMRLLSIRKGSLDDSERAEIESHVAHTYDFLKQIPWTHELRQIPQIALAHHEKLNGRGYPAQLAAPEIPLQARMMAVADVFDALAASDRPYKKAVSVERALEILEMMVRDGDIDPDVYQLFVKSRIYERWTVEPSAY